MRQRLFLVTLLVAGCETTPPSDGQYVTGFHPDPMKAGYTRYVGPIIPAIPAGSDVEWCQWVAAPADEDRDVLSVLGYQSRTGHHAVLYATSKTRVPIGESHICTEDDMLSLSFLGAIGGEGNATDITHLPEGLNFRLQKGLGLMINSHFVNASLQAVDGQAVIDVQFSPPSVDHLVADLFASNGATFTIDPGQTLSYDVNCVLPHEMKFAMATNHMHGYGLSAFSELIHIDGSREEVVRDDSWSADQKFNPRYARYTMAAPRVGRTGDTFHTQCTWKNTSEKPLAFPTEMCAGVGFYFPGVGTITCSDGQWEGR